jgi:hypothetical protein
MDKASRSLAPCETGELGVHTSPGQHASNQPTMKPTKVLLSFLLLAAVPLSSAFAPPTRTLGPSPSVSVEPLRASSHRMPKAWGLLMSSENEGDSDQVAPSKNVPTSGTFYDDEVSDNHRSSAPNHGYSLPHWRDAFCCCLFVHRPQPFARPFSSAHLNLYRLIRSPPQKKAFQRA